MSLIYWCLASLSQWFHVMLNSLGDVTLKTSQVMDTEGSSRCLLALPSGLWYPRLWNQDVANRWSTPPEQWLALPKNFKIHLLICDMTSFHFKIKTLFPEQKKSPIHLGGGGRRVSGCSLPLWYYSCLDLPYLLSSIPPRFFKITLNITILNDLVLALQIMASQIHNSHQPKELFKPSVPLQTYKQ